MERKAPPVPESKDLKHTPESSSPRAGRVTAAMLIEKIESLQKTTSPTGTPNNTTSNTSSTAPLISKAPPPKSLPPPELVRADPEMQANLTFLLQCIKRQKEQQIERTEVIDIVLD
jgi:hypothetical protein